MCVYCFICPSVAWGNGRGDLAGMSSVLPGCRRDVVGMPSVVVCGEVVSITLLNSMCLFNKLVSSLQYLVCLCKTFAFMRFVIYCSFSCFYYTACFYAALVL